MEQDNTQASNKEDSPLSVGSSSSSSGYGTRSSTDTSDDKYVRIANASLTVRLGPPQVVPLLFASAGRVVLRFYSQPVRWHVWHAPRCSAAASVRAPSTALSGWWPTLTSAISSSSRSATKRTRGPSTSDSCRHRRWIRPTSSLKCGSWESLSYNRVRHCVSGKRLAKAKCSPSANWKDRRRDSTTATLVSPNTAACLARQTSSASWRTCKPATAFLTYLSVH